MIGRVMSWSYSGKYSYLAGSSPEYLRGDRKLLLAGTRALTIGRLIASVQ